MSNSKITAVINTYNEQENIQACIESLRLLTPHILVVDTHSTDQTVKIAQSLQVEIVQTKRSYFVEPIRQFSIDQVLDGWIFILDADERMTTKLAKEIQEIVAKQHTTQNSQPPTFYRVPRKNMFAAKKWLKHGGWYPDYQIRFFQKASFIEWPNSIHSTPRFTGADGYLKNPILHFVHRNLESMVEKTILFETHEADLLLNANRSVNVPIFFRKFLGELNRRLILKAGFLDGTTGIIESIYQAFSKTITYLYLYEKKKSRTV